MNSSELLPDPGKRPLAALRDALLFPCAEAALLTNLVLVACRLLASVLPVFGLPLHVLAWLWAYKYGLESLAATGAGRQAAPEGWSEVDERVHSQHFWLQLLLLMTLLAATRLAPEPMRGPLLLALATVFPALVLALAASQNFWAALNPLNWWLILARAGRGYVLLALASWGVLWLQAAAGMILDGLQPRLLAIAVFYAIAQHLTFALFRLLGLSLHAFPPSSEAPVTDGATANGARDRDADAKREQAAKALQEADPAARAQALALLLPRGVPEPLHQEYRQCLRRLGDQQQLLAHARVRICQLLALGDPRAAAVLAIEALADDAHLALPDAASSQALSLACENLGLVRQAAQVLANYRLAYPRRFDGLPLALRAATLFADQLQEADLARRLLRAAQPLAAPGEEAETFRQVLAALDAGRPLAPLTAPG